MSLSKLPSHLWLIKKLGNLNLVLMPGSKEITNMAAAVVPHSLGLRFKLIWWQWAMQWELRQLLLLVFLPIQSPFDCGKHGLWLEPRDEECNVDGIEPFKDYFFMIHVYWESNHSLPGSSVKWPKHVPVFYCHMNRVWCYPSVPKYSDP